MLSKKYLVPHGPGAAYLRAEQRQFQNGSPEDDWLQAEAEIDYRLSNAQISEQNR